MNFTYESINNIKPALDKLSKLDLKAAEAVRLARLLGKIENELRYYRETKVALFKKFGEEKNGGYEIKPENKEEFLKEYRELCNTEIKIETDKVTIKSDISIDASSVLALEGLVDFSD